MCNECHDTGRISSTRRTRTDWEDQIDQMIQEGAKGTDKEFETVVGYLLRTFGKVYINSAKADEIVAVLTLSQKDADAIVAYRTANGKFADFDALKKVPGIDVKKLEGRQDAVGF
jgi:competence protein ComEA